MTGGEPRDPGGSAELDPLGPVAASAETGEVDSAQLEHIEQEVAQEVQSTTPQLWGRGTIISLLITVGLFVGMAFLVPIDEVWGALKTCNVGLVIAAGLSHYATYWVRGVRWRRTLRHLQGKHGNGKFGLLVFFYNFVDNVVPAKLGDVYGAHLARINLGVQRSAALGSIVFLRMIDAWFLLCLAAVSSLILFAESLPEWVVWALVGGGVLAAVMTLPLVIFGVMKKAPPERLPQALRARIDSFQAGMWPRRRELATIAGLTIGIWILESLWMYLLVAAFGIQLDLVGVLFVTTISLIASAFPLTPSGTGAVEASLVGCLLVLGVPDTVAVAVTVLNRLIDYWLHIGLGLVVWALRHRLGLRTWREVPVEVEESTNPG